MFLTGKLDDPSMVQPLYIAAFEQQDGSYNIVWSRPQRQDVMTTRSTDAGGTDNPFDGGVDLEMSIEGEPATTDTGTSESRRKAPALPDDVKDEGPF